MNRPTPEITMLDSHARTREILAAPVARREDLLRAMRSPMDGMLPFAPDGPDQVALHCRGFGFPLQGSDDVLRAGLERLREADAWGRVGTALRRGARVLLDAVPDLVIPDITVLLTLGDPTDDHFMTEIEGLAAFGGMSGYIELTVWPNDTVLNRLEAIAVHELHHNVRYGPGGVVWDPATVRLGEQVVAEGLADAFAVELYGDRGWTHFAAAAMGRDDVVCRVIADLRLAGMQHFMPRVLGDASARRLGLEPVGLPTGAGYAAGRAIVEAHLTGTDASAAGLVRAPWEEVAGL